MNYWISLPGESGTCAILVRIKNTAKESTATILPQKYHLLWLLSYTAKKNLMMTKYLQ